MVNLVLSHASIDVMVIACRCIAECKLDNLINAETRPSLKEFNLHMTYHATDSQTKWRRYDIITAGVNAADCFLILMTIRYLLRKQVYVIVLVT